MYAIDFITFHLGMCLATAKSGQGTREAGRSAEGRVSKKLRRGSQVDTDFWHELFDTQAGPVARVSRLSI